VRGYAPELGADTEAVLDELGMAVEAKPALGSA
jgi:crotonobetainyl-CoA:carnitine CoA-transferase CaiB-like acyl-CoA transferase